VGAAGIAAGFMFLCAVGAMAQSATPPVSLVSVAASSQGLPQVATTAVPRVGGTYWWVLEGGYPVPAPCLPLDFNGAVFQISSNEYLLDLSGGDVNPRRFGLPANLTDATVVAAANDEVQSLEGLITWIQAVSQQTLTPETTMSLSAKPMDGGGGFSPDYSTSNGPYLTIAPTGTNQFLVTVYNNTSPAIYEIWWTAALANPDYPWQQIVIGASGQTNFTVGNVSPNGFFTAIWDTNGVPTSGLTITIQSPLNGSVLY